MQYYCNVYALKTHGHYQQVKSKGKSQNNWAHQHTIWYILFCSSPDVSNDMGKKQGIGAAMPRIQIDIVTGQMSTKRTLLGMTGKENIHESRVKFT